MLPRVIGGPGIDWSKECLAEQTCGNHHNENDGDGSGSKQPNVAERYGTVLFSEKGHVKPLPVVHSLGLKTRRLLAGSPLDLRYIAVDASGLRQGRESRPCHTPAEVVWNALLRQDSSRLKADGTRSRLPFLSLGPSPRAFPPAAVSPGSRAAPGWRYRASHSSPFRDNNSGSLAMLAAIRRASSCVSTLACRASFSSLRK